jgi:putative membrane protein insertion efficiency factor
VSLAARLLILIVRIYQATLGHFMAGHCRFHPTCSHYALEALAAHGALRGSWLALRRIARCHPFASGGFDPVPLRRCAATDAHG